MTTIPHDSMTRPAITHSFTIDGVQGYLNVGLDEDGNPWEIFLTITKEGSTLGGFADAFARLTSTALQYRVPLKVLCRRMRGLRFAPCGITTNRAIPTTESIIDYVFTWLEMTFPATLDGATMPVESF